MDLPSYANPYQSNVCMEFSRWVNAMGHLNTLFLLCYTELYRAQISSLPHGGISPRFSILFRLSRRRLQAFLRAFLSTQTLTGLPILLFHLYYITFGECCQVFYLTFRIRLCIMRKIRLKMQKGEELFQLLAL